MTCVCNVCSVRARVCAVCVRTCVCVSDCTTCTLHTYRAYRVLGESATTHAAIITSACMNNAHVNPDSCHIDK